MTEIAHNHPPNCCCWVDDTEEVRRCPLCPEHGELAQLNDPRPGECPICHSQIGRQHTEYCRFIGRVSAMTAALPPPMTGLHTQTSQPRTEIRVRQPDGTTRPATRDDTLDLIGIPPCTCPPAQIVGSGGDTIDQAEAPDCPRHGEPGPEIRDTDCDCPPPYADCPHPPPIRDTRVSTHVPVYATDRWPAHPITECSPGFCGEPAYVHNPCWSVDCPTGPDCTDTCLTRAAQGAKSNHPQPTPLATPTPTPEIHHVPTPHPRIGTCTPDCNNTPNRDHPR
jgi:hypothetical protein